MLLIYMRPNMNDANENQLANSMDCVQFYFGIHLFRLVWRGSADVATESVFQPIESNGQTLIVYRNGSSI